MGNSKIGSESPSTIQFTLYPWMWRSKFHTWQVMPSGRVHQGKLLVMLGTVPSVLVIVHLTTPKSRVIPADLPNYTQDVSLFCSLFLFFKGTFKKIWFIYFWLCWVFVAVPGLSLDAASRATLLQCLGFSWWWLLLLQSTGSKHWGSVVVAHRLSSPTACGIVPDQGSNPCSLH